MSDASISVALEWVEADMVGGAHVALLRGGWVRRAVMQGAGEGSLLAGGS